MLPVCWCCCCGNPCCCCCCLASSSHMSPRSSPSAATPAGAEAHVKAQMHKNPPPCPRPRSATATYRLYWVQPACLRRLCVPQCCHVCFVESGQLRQPHGPCPMPHEAQLHAQLHAPPQSQHQPASVLPQLTPASGRRSACTASTAAAAAAACTARGLLWCWSSSATSPAISSSCACATLAPALDMPSAAPFADGTQQRLYCCTALQYNTAACSLACRSTSRPSCASGSRAAASRTAPAANW